MARKWYTALALLLLFPAALSSASTKNPRPNVLLIVIDTLRYSATGENTPFLTSLGTRGVVFTNVYSTHDFTPTSHFSMLTGLQDGLGSDDDRPENGVPYQLQRIGYQTFATVANDLIGKKQMPSFGGFADFKQTGDINSGTIFDAVAETTNIDMHLAMFGCRPTPHNQAMLYFSADRLLPLFLDQIRKARAPYFGFVNLVDPHEPYVPDPQIYPPEKSLPPGFNGDVVQRRLSPELARPDDIPDPQRRAYVKAKIAEAGAASLTAIDLSEEARRTYRRRYRAKVRGADATLRQFFAILEREKLLDNTVVIITSDHGESFGEADLITHMFHDRGDYESTHHVPMLIVLPPKMRATAKVIDRRVSIANIPATIYDLVGLDCSGFKKEHAYFGHSLLPLFASDPPPYTAKVVVPKREKQDNSEAAREREKALKSLGYVH
jgi:arylsulfatase A-like enzyme